MKELNKQEQIIQENKKKNLTEQAKDSLVLKGPLAYTLLCFPSVSGLYKYSYLKILDQPIQPIQPLNRFLPRIPPIPQPSPFPNPIPTPQPIPYPFPQPIPQPIPQPFPQPIPQPIPIFFIREEIRLDVDGDYPQMVVSGIKIGFKYSVHWIANLRTNPTGWDGDIWYKDGDVNLFPYTHVDITVNYGLFPTQRTLTITFTGGGGTTFSRTYKFLSKYFHGVDFEFDSATGESATTSYNTCTHPNRPNNIRCEDLTIETVYRRAGFDVTTTSGDVVPIMGAGIDAEWSNQEMHDAMQTYWSHFSSQGQWAIWVFFASLHEMGTGLGGIMFDDIGPNHRQGTAIFNDSFISNAPVGDADPVAWVERNLFWTACHEMGHAFNLAHSWQKSWDTGWIPLVNEPQARSFMNYPSLVTGGQAAFFSDFEFRFSDGELLFLRHTPTRFIQPGNADWFDDHGFQGFKPFYEPLYKLEIRVNRENTVFEYLEPVNLELKLTNISTQPQLVDEHMLSMSDSLIVVLKPEGKPARQFYPYARYLWEQKKIVLQPGESLYEVFSVSAGRNGWDISLPGDYTINLATKVDGNDIVSNPLKLRITPAHNYKEELIAQDFFSEDIGRIFAFKGSQFFTNGNKTLNAIIEKLPERRVALHANFILGNTVARNYKLLVRNNNKRGQLYNIEINPAQTKEAQNYLSTALINKPEIAVESFGHISFKRHVDVFSDWLVKQGAREEAIKTQDTLYETMSKRRVHGRPILQTVLGEIEKKRDSY